MPEGKKSPLDSKKIDWRLPPKGELSEEKVKKKIHNLTGIITSKELYKVYHKNSPYQGNQCYKLQIVLEDKEEVRKKLFIYPNLVSPQIFQTIQESQFIDKRYLFFCEKKKKGWILHDWRELPSNESSPNQSQLENRVQYEKK